MALPFALGVGTRSKPKRPVLPDPPAWMLPTPPEGERVEKQPEPSWWSRLLAVAVGARHVLGDRPPAGVRAVPVPASVRDPARECGLDLSSCVWKAASRGAPWTARRTFFVDSVVEPSDRYVVKIAWHPHADAQLHEEHRALRSLSARTPVPRSAFPAPLFFSRRDGAAISGQRRIEGAPFRERTDGSATCAYAERALQLLVDIGAGTFRPREALPFEEKLAEVVDAFGRRFRRRRNITDFLRAQVELLASAGSLPTVLQHGDPDARNLIVTPRQEVVFVDWETCNVEGLPLMDLYWFAHGFGKVAAAKSGVRYGADVFARQYLERTLYSVQLARAVAESCDRLALSPRLAEPLFHLAWAVRAVRDERDGALCAAILDRSVAGSLRNGGIETLQG